MSFELRSRLKQYHSLVGTIKNGYPQDTLLEMWCKDSYFADSRIQACHIDYYRELPKSF